MTTMNVTLKGDITTIVTLDVLNETITFKGKILNALSQQFKDIATIISIVGTNEEIAFAKYLLDCIPPKF